MVQPIQTTPSVLRTIHRQAFFIKLVTWVLIVCFVGLQVPAGYAQTARYAKQKSYATTCPEVDNVNVPMYGNYVNSYRVTALFPTRYYPLQPGQEDACGYMFNDPRTKEPLCATEFPVAGRPRVGYYATSGGGELKYIERSPAEWWEPAVTVDTVNDVGQYVSLADPLSMAYYDATAQDLKFVYRQENGSWSAPVVVDSAGDVGKFASMDVTPDKYYHVAYYDATAGDLKAAQKSGANWQAPVTVDNSANNVGQYASLKVDWQGGVHVAYYDATAGDLKYVQKIGTAWQAPVTIDNSANNVGQYASLSVDGVQNIHVVYYDATAGDLKYVWKNGAAWQTPVTIDSANDVGKYCSADCYYEAETAAAKTAPWIYPHVAYYDATAGDLKYIRKTASGWSTPQVLDANCAGLTAIGLAMNAVYPDGLPHVGYVVGGNLRYMYETKSGAQTGWPAVRTLDGSGTVGSYVSLEMSGFTPTPGNLCDASWWNPASGTYTLYDDGNVLLTAVPMWGWWRPNAMSVDVVGGRSCDTVYQIVLTKRMADADQWPQIFVLYADGWTRPDPMPPADRPEDLFVCMGASVVMGPSPEKDPLVDEVDRTFAAISHVTFDPAKLEMRLEYEAGGSSLLTFKPERGQTVIEVTDISYDTLTVPALTFQSMYATEDKCDVAYIEPESGNENPIMGSWMQLVGDGWLFYRKNYSMHNTSAPDITVEVLGPLGYYVTSQAEAYSSVNGLTTYNRSDASGGQTVRGTGDATYNLNLTGAISNAVIDARYIGDTGGRVLSVYVDSALKATFTTVAATTYRMTGQLSLGTNLTAGGHALKLALSGAGNAELDYFAVHSGVVVEPLRTWDDVWGSAVWYTSSSNQYTFDRASQQRNHTVVADQVQSAIKAVYDKARGDTGTEDLFGSLAAKIQPWDFSENDYFSFWVYNDGGPLTFRVRLEDTTGQRWESNWANPGGEDRLRMRTSSADWESIVVDLTRAFSATNINLHAIQNIAFIADPGNGASVGTFFIDDVKLQRSPKEAPIEVFEADYYGWSTASNSVFTITNTTEDCHNAGAATDLGQSSLKVAWGMKNLLAHNVAYNPLHDTNAPVGRIGNLADLTRDGNNTLSVWVKSTTDNNFPVMATLFDVAPGTNAVGEPIGGHSVDLGVVSYTGAGGWQELRWRYGGKSEATNAHLVAFFPFNNTADGGGVLYLDDLNLLALPAVDTGIDRMIEALDGILDDLTDPETALETLLGGLALAGVAYYLYKFVRDYLNGFKAMKQVVATWRNSISDVMIRYPNATFFGSLWTTRGVFLAATFSNLHTALVDTAPLSSQSALSLAFGLGYLGALNISFANLSRLMVSQFLDSIVNDRVLPRMDYSAGIPDAQRMVAVWPGAFIDLQLAADANGETVFSEAATREMYRGIFDKIERAIEQNPDPKNNIIYGFVSDSKGDSLPIEKEEFNNWIKSVKVNHPNTKVFWMRRHQTFYNMLGPTGGKRGRELKGGAIEDFLSWLDGRLPVRDFAHEGIETGGNEEYRIVGSDRTWIEFEGTHTLEQIFGTSTSPVPIENYFSIDAGDYPGPRSIVTMAELLGHPSNARYPLISPDCKVGNTEDSMLANLFGIARAEMRAVGRVVWKLFDVADCYGKFGGKVGICTDVWLEHHLPPQSVLGEDLPMGMMLQLEPAALPPEQRYRVGYSEDVVVLEEAPGSPISEKLTAVKWTPQDMTTSPLGGFNVRRFPYWTDKFPVVGGDFITPIKNFYSRWRIRSNLFARLGDPALLIVFMIDIISKVAPGLTSLADATQALGLYVASLVSLIVIPRVTTWYKEGGAKLVAKRIGYDTPIITLIMLEGILDKSIALFRSVEAYRENICVFNIKRPSLVEYQFKPKFFVSPYTIPGVVEGDPKGWSRSIMGNMWHSFALGTGIIVSSVVLNLPFTWYEIPFLASWAGGSQVLGWMYARKDFQEVARDIKGGGKDFYNWLRALYKKGHLKPLIEGESGGPYPPMEESESIAPEAEIEETLDVTRDLTHGSHEFMYKEQVLGKVGYQQSSDLSTVFIDELNTVADPTGLLSAQEIGRALILETVTRIVTANHLLDAPLADPTMIGVARSISQSGLDAVNSLIRTEQNPGGPLSFLRSEGNYHIYKFEVDLTSVRFTVGGTDNPGTVIYDGNSLGIVTELGRTKTMTIQTLDGQPRYAVQNFKFMGTLLAVDQARQLLRMVIDGREYLINLPAVPVDGVKFDLVDGNGNPKPVELTRDQLKFCFSPCQTMDFMGAERADWEFKFAELGPMREAEWNQWEFKARPANNEAAGLLYSKTIGLEPKMLVATWEVGGSEKAVWTLWGEAGEKIDLTWEQVVKQYPKLAEGGVPLVNEAGEPVAWIIFKDGSDVTFKGKMFNPATPAEPIKLRIDPNEATMQVVGDIIEGKGLSGVRKGAKITLVMSTKPGGRVGLSIQGLQTWTEGIGEKLGLGVIRDIDAYFELKVNGDATGVLFVPTPEQIPAAPMVRTSPQAVRRIIYQALGWLNKPYGTGGLQIALLGGAIVVIEYAGGKYVSSDELLGADLLGVAAATAAWTIGDLALKKLATLPAVEALELGVLGGSVTFIPLFVLTDAAVAYADSAYWTWRAGERFKGIEELNMASFQASYPSWARAWLGMMRHYDMLLHMGALYGDDQQTFVGPLVEQWYMDHWKATPEGQESWRALLELQAYQAGVYAGDAAWAAAQTEKAKRINDVKREAEHMGEPYAQKFRNLILDPLFRGLSWYTGLSAIGPDEYGWPMIGDGWIDPHGYPYGHGRVREFGHYALTDYPATGVAGPPPVPATNIITKLAPKMQELQQYLETGDMLMGVYPLTEYMPGQQAPTLNDVKGWVWGYLKQLSAWCEAHWLDKDPTTRRTSTPSGVVMPDLWHVEWVNNDLWMDCRTTIGTCTQLMDRLVALDFGSLGYFDTLIPNMAFESVDAADISISTNAVSTNYWTIPNDQILNGVRYRWDVRGHNPSGWSPKSDRRSFVPTP